MLKGPWVTDGVKHVEKCAIDYFKNSDASHDMQHVYRVVALALDIAKTETDEIEEFELVCLTALLHDLCDHKYEKYDPDKLKNVLQYVKDDGKYSKYSKIDKVLNAVKRVSWSYQKNNPEDTYNSLALRCTRDADRLDAIGAIGIARCFIYGSIIKNSIEKSRQHFDDKLLKLTFETKRGQELANDRMKLLRTFVEQFDSEILNFF